jgi:hypothetical protein
MKYTFVTYSSTKYQQQQIKLLQYANGLGVFDQVQMYSDSWLKNEDFYKKNKNILDEERGAGFWLWKSYVIHKTLKTLVNEGDVVFYIDCGDFFNKNVVEYTRPILEKEPCLLLGGGYPQKDWTKRDCFYYMDADKPKFTDVVQLEAGVQFWKKTDLSMKVLEEQIKFSQDYRISTDSPNECGYPNYPNYQKHQSDQSILTNLFVKYDLPVDSMKHETPYVGMRNYVRCNVND